MPNYKQMYLTLVHEVSNTIEGLTAALQKAETIFIEGDDTQLDLARSREYDEEAATE